jgi:23S rRNA pseudouridine1911/1915/1917 synthase
MVLEHTALRSGKLLTFLRRELGLSSSLVKRLKWHNAFRVNGQPVHTDHMVCAGDVITADLAEEVPDFPPEDGPLDILYEDDALLAVDKPPGLLMHPTFYRTTGTLANRLLGYYQKTGQSCAVHPVSRLDRDTFGVTLFAKNAHIHAAMITAHQDGSMEKLYHALVLGAPDMEEGSWHWPIARVEGGSLLRQVRNDGQSAETRYKILVRQQETSLLQLQAVTGRTHQLRVHCAYAGCPILGDPQYGGEAAQRPGLAHQQLLAAQLTFLHPVTGQTVVLQSRQSLGTP